MHVIRRRGWEIPERLATPEHLFFNRRAFLAATGAAALSLSPSLRCAQRVATCRIRPSDLYPVKRNEKFTLDRPVTDEKINTQLQQFLRVRHRARTSPRRRRRSSCGPGRSRSTAWWRRRRRSASTISFARCRWRSGSIATAASRHGRWRSPGPAFRSPSSSNWRSRCRRRNMCAWKPSSIPRSRRASGQTWYPWPYVEGLTIAEATNELAFLVTGAYGKPVSKQQGAPLRLAVPWKYGFKSIKSIVRFNFTDQRPKSYWEALQASEYGFWANVNPQVPHPRWSQATEELIGLKASAGRRCCSTAMATTSPISTRASRRNGSGRSPTRAKSKAYRRAA